jgi:hypothetical protein
MRFDEPDVREAYRRGARDLYDSVIGALKSRPARQIETWIAELESWNDGEPPHPPIV